MQGRPRRKRRPPDCPAPPRPESHRRPPFKQVDAAERNGVEAPPSREGRPARAAGARRPAGARLAGPGALRHVHAGRPSVRRGNEPRAQVGTGPAVQPRPAGRPGRQEARQDAHRRGGGLPLLRPAPPQPAAVGRPPGPARRARPGQAPPDGDGAAAGGQDDRPAHADPEGPASGPRRHAAVARQAEAPDRQGGGGRGARRRGGPARRPAGTAPRLQSRLQSRCNGIGDLSRCNGIGDLSSMGRPSKGLPKPSGAR